MAGELKQQVASVCQISVFSAVNQLEGQVNVGMVLDK